ncbi:hypothetical protein QYE76_027491 [Lolium multiflorum]|uniref:Uncharacterized protein n=1 Tax=Lolium multiflorum TaxID=4521 RepID=A0AAD8QJ70_LOLMU|nr:hypothetical protein QYE76_027491 [Lolium multiflorum]
MKGVACESEVEQRTGLERSRVPWFSIAYPYLCCSMTGVPASMAVGADHQARMLHCSHAWGCFAVTRRTTSGGEATGDSEARLAVGGTGIAGEVGDEGGAAASFDLENYASERSGLRERFPVFREWG